MTECMRTNIVLNDELLREAQRFSRAKTKTALVEEALKVLVEVRSREEKHQAYERRLVAVQRATQGKRFRTSSAEVLRQDRERE